jgi:hypothetical protein
LLGLKRFVRHIFVLQSSCEVVLLPLPLVVRDSSSQVPTHVFATKRVRFIGIPVIQLVNE